MKLNIADLAYFNEKAGKWVIEPGDYKVSVGSSSKDIRLATTIHVIK